MPPLLADFIHIKVCKPNLRKTLDTTMCSIRNRATEIVNAELIYTK